LAPDGRVHRLVVQLHHAEEGVLALLLALHDVHEQRGDRGRGEGGGGGDREKGAAGEAGGGSGGRLAHRVAAGGTFVADSSRCPTDPWQRMQEIPESPWPGVPISATMGPWHRRQFASAIFRLVGVARMGSSKVPVVK